MLNVFKKKHKTECMCDQKPMHPQERDKNMNENII